MREEGEGSLGSSVLLSLHSPPADPLTSPVSAHSSFFKSPPCPLTLHSL
jgi:hypothetical protein